MLLCSYKGPLSLRGPTPTWLCRHPSSTISPLPGLKTSSSFEALNVSRKSNYQLFIAQWCWACWLLFWGQGTLLMEKNPARMRVLREHRPTPGGVKKRNWRLWVCVAHSTAKGCLCLRSSTALWCEQKGVPSTNEQVVSGGLRLWVGQSLLPGLLGTSIPLFFPLGFMVIFTFRLVFASGPLWITFTIPLIGCLKLNAVTLVVC